MRQATRMDIITFEDACSDLNELATATWRAILVCKNLVATRQTTSREKQAAPSWKLCLLLARVVRAYRARRIARVKAEFGPHEKVVTQVQARIRGFLERRGLRTDAARAEQEGEADAKTMIAKMLEAQETLASTVHGAGELAAEHGDTLTEDLCIARGQVHEKFAWMLRAHLQ